MWMEGKERDINMSAIDKFKIYDKIAIITGGAGFLGRKHAEAIIEAGGTAILLDISNEALTRVTDEFRLKYDNPKIEGIKVNISDKESIEHVRNKILKKYGHIDILINNAANNPKVEGANTANMSNIQFENFPLSLWEDDIKVGLTGAVICTQVFGMEMAKAGTGVILNISSDLGIIAPDQRIYRKRGLEENEQTVKPVTYSVIKHGLIGLTKYTATYWAQKGVRANALCPAGVYNGQNDEFLEKLEYLIPMGRMADKDEYKSTILYMVSDASSYMTGSVVIVDGGRTCW